MTGVDDPYESPVNPDVTLETQQSTPDECAERIEQVLIERGLLDDARMARAVRPFGPTRVRAA